MRPYVTIKTLHIKHHTKKKMNVHGDATNKEANKEMKYMTKEGMKKS